MGGWGPLGGRTAVGVRALGVRQHRPPSPFALAQPERLWCAWTMLSSDPPKQIELAHRGVSYKLEFKSMIYMVIHLCRYTSL